MVLAPEHELVDVLTAARVARRRRPALDVRRRQPPPRPSPRTAPRSPPSRISSARRTRPRPACSSARTPPIRPTANRFRSSSPTTCWPGYGTGAIMAVPAVTSATGSSPTSSASRSWKCCRRRYFTGRLHRRRRARQLRLPQRAERGVGQGGDHQTAGRRRARAGRIEYKLRDWLFARQRYWGEPFPIVYDADGRRTHCRIGARRAADDPDNSPVLFDPDDADSEPSPPLAKATDWVHVELDLGDGEALHPRHQRDAAVGGQLMVRAALHRPAQLRRVLRQGERGLLDGPAAGRARPVTRAASTCMSAASSTPCCTCCTRGSGTRCSTTSATSAP